MDSAVRYMREHYQEKLTLQEVADRCYVSQWHLSKLLNKYMEMSFYDILNSIRIENAKRLLENPGLKIGQIGEMVGYADAAHLPEPSKSWRASTPTSTGTGCGIPDLLENAPRASQPLCEADLPGGIFGRGKLSSYGSPRYFRFPRLQNRSMSWLIY